MIEFMDHDDSLEVGLAAGLDIPTAMVLSEVKEPRPPKSNQRAGFLIIVVLTILAALWIVLGRL